jgi:hypothetical protein
MPARALSRPVVNGNVVIKGALVNTVYANQISPRFTF